MLWKSIDVEGLRFVAKLQIDCSGCRILIESAEIFDLASTNAQVFICASSESFDCPKWIAQRTDTADVHGPALLDKLGLSVKRCIGC